jgi:hypothetical protein
MTQSDISELSSAIQRLVDIVIEKKNKQEMMVEIDSIHIDT